MLSFCLGPSGSNGSSGAREASRASGTDGASGANEARFQKSKIPPPTRLFYYSKLARLRMQSWNPQSWSMQACFQSCPPQKKSADQDEKDGLHDLAPILDLFSQYSVLLLRRRLLLLLLLVLLLPLLPLLQLLYLITVRLATYDLQTNLQTAQLIITMLPVAENPRTCNPVRGRSCSRLLTKLHSPFAGL